MRIADLSGAVGKQLKTDGRRDAAVERPGMDLQRVFNSLAYRSSAPGRNRIRIVAYSVGPLFAIFHM